MPRVRLKGLSTRGDILIAMSGEEQRARYLLVRSGGRSYGVAADQVRHVVRGLLCHPVPGSRPHLLGLAQYGGEPLAVLDLQALLEKGRPRANYRATVVLGRRGRRSRTMIGLAVDEARRVERLPEMTPAATTGALVQGTVTLDGETVELLDASVLLEDRLRDSGGENG